MERAVKQLRERMGRNKSERREGLENFNAEAEKWGADCIFVGARGLNGLERLLLGSVSTAVASYAHCSVEVVRPQFRLD